MRYQEVLDFWFDELEPKDWFVKNPELDERIRERFLALHQEIARGEHANWQETPEGTLAAVIVLDQFSRNMFRDTAESFAYDERALAMSQTAVEKGFDKKLSKEQQSFLYMPYMHSESKEIHEEALQLFEKLGNEENLKYEKLHKKIIDQFGRYPHRNKILGRETTPEEQHFLDTDEHASF